MFVEQKVSILCPICGIKFTPDNSNICPACTLASLDNQTLLSPGEEQNYCTYCLRYERPPWVNCDRESPELLGILLKKIKGLSKLELKDAKFVWTEPHSKRIKIKVEFVRSVNQTTRIQQSQIVEFIEKYTQCYECKKNFTPHDWNTQIQIRQHASHKRTLLALQQNLMRQKWTEKALRVETAEGGFDMLYRNQQDAHGCLNYIKNHLPVTCKTSSQFISHNERDNTTNVKTTHALIIPKICKDDLLLMHPKWAKPLGCSTLLLCVKVTSQLYFLDPTNNRRLVITPTQFFALEPYADIFQLKHLAKNYIILDNQGPRSEQSHNQFGSWGLVVARSDQMKEIFIKSHINAEVGQQYEGYSLQDWAYIKNMPEHLLVKKMKTEDEKEKKKLKKDLKRKEQRIQKKKARLLESQSVSQVQQSQVGEKDENEGQEWVDIDEDDV